MTTISTVLFLVVWGLIIIAYINYSRKNPDLHKRLRINYLAENIWAISFLYSLYLCLDYCLSTLKQDVRYTLFRFGLYY